MNILNLIMDNIYLYICIIIGLVILITILAINIINSSKRKKIKNDYEEVEKMEEAVEEVSEESKISNELESIIQKMQEDMEVKPEDVVKKFEEEQEEKAIISYQELVNNVKNGKIEVIDDDNSDINYVESLIEDSNIEEPISTVEEVETVTPEMVKDAIETISNRSIKEEPKKFKQSKFISPIFGYMDNNIEYTTVKKENTLDIMNTKDYNKLTEEIKRQEEFLNALKEFRNNL